MGSILSEKEKMDTCILVLTTVLNGVVCHSELNWEYFSQWEFLNLNRGSKHNLELQLEFECKDIVNLTRDVYMH